MKPFTYSSTSMTPTSPVSEIAGNASFELDEFSMTTISAVEVA
jgi:hypothetical protein